METSALATWAMNVLSRRSSNRRCSAGPRHNCCVSARTPRMYGYAIASRLFPRKQSTNLPQRDPPRGDRGIGSPGFSGFFSGASHSSWSTGSRPCARSAARQTRKQSRFLTQQAVVSRPARTCVRGLDSIPGDGGPEDADSCEADPNRPASYGSMTSTHFNQLRSDSPTTHASSNLWKNFVGDVERMSLARRRPVFMQASCPPT